MVEQVVEKMTDLERKNLRIKIAGRAASVATVNGIVG